MHKTLLTFRLLNFLYFRKNNQNINLLLIPHEDSDLHFDPANLVFSKNDKIKHITFLLSSSLNLVDELYLHFEGNVLKAGKSLGYYPAIVDNTTIKVSNYNAARDE